ncbi:MAG: fatty acid desaturase [Opitutales bacterium]|nr:fatty acid desaturase [Opitutales bacterium]NRA25850.1 fatty acid desaturase [Opitutales bacterium]
MSSAKENIRSIRDQVQPSPSISTWQVVSTLVFFVATIYGLSVVSSVWLIGFCFLPLLALIGIRLFVLQHDCGHLSLYQRKASNDIAGQVLAWFTTVPYELWRSEHRWHHLNQGNLSSRGVDMMNSPPTVDELKNEPEKADDWNAKVSSMGVFFAGAWSLLVARKSVNEFFMFRQAYLEDAKNAAKLRRGIWVTHIGAIVVHISLFLMLGWQKYAFVLVPAYLLAGGFGSLLFWIQHNFEDSYFAWEDEWDFYKVGTDGSSYLKLPFPLSYFTAHIGLHHVHHLNMQIPNYKLDLARNLVPELARVQPLSFDDLRNSFTHLFWDEVKGKKVKLTREALPPQSPDA